MKKLWPVIIVVVVAILLLIIRVKSKKEGLITPWGGLGTGQKEQPAGEEKTFTGKLKDALSLAESMKCVWKKDENNYGTSYIKNQKIYTDVTTAGKRMFSIIADNCTYSWEEGKTAGFKMCFEREKGEEETSLPEEFSWEEPEISYSCEKMVVADSLFNPPGEIQFIGPADIIKP